MIPSFHIQVLAYHLGREARLQLIHVLGAAYMPQTFITPFTVKVSLVRHGTHQGQNNERQIKHSVYPKHIIHVPANQTDSNQAKLSS